MVSDAIDHRRLMELYERRLAADPGSRAFLPLAELYRTAARHGDARRILEDGLSRQPGFVSAMVALAQVLLDTGEEAAALARLDRVIERDPDNLVALRLLAATAENRADWATACHHLQRLVRLDAGDLEAADRCEAARQRLAVEAGTAPPPPAATPVGERPRSSSVVGPLGGVVTLTLADLYLRQGYHERARGLLERMAAAEPDRQDVRERLERLARAEAAGAPAGVLARRRTAAERVDERHRFENWRERAGEE